MVDPPYQIATHIWVRTQRLARNGVDVKLQQEAVEETRKLARQPNERWKERTGRLLKYRRQDGNFLWRRQVPSSRLVGANPCYISEYLTCDPAFNTLTQVLLRDSHSLNKPENFLGYLGKEYWVRNLRKKPP